MKLGERVSRDGRGIRGGCRVEIIKTHYTPSEVKERKTE